MNADLRFAFGANWLRFLNSINDEKVSAAKAALTAMLGDISGKTFLDVGCGSGLSSLAATLLGAKVRAFDYDPQSVACTRELQRRYGVTWPVEEGSALDDSYLASLGKFDIVYSWGVLHHTGNMRKAFQNVSGLVSHNGVIFISIYNDQGTSTIYWKAEKWLYNHGLKWPMIVLHLPLLFGRYAVRFIKRKKLERGMSIWNDYIDWLGGYPFEVATPNEVISSFMAMGFQIARTKRVGRRNGCNEFVFHLPPFNADTSASSLSMRA